MLLGENFLYMEVSSQREGLDSLRLSEQTIEIVALMKASAQTEYIVTGLAPDAISVSAQTEYIIQDVP